MDFKKIDIEHKVAFVVADKITDSLDRSDSKDNVADGKFDKQNEIYEALGIEQKDETGYKKFYVNKNTYRAIQNKLFSMIQDAMKNADFTAINKFLKQFNINVNIHELIFNATTSIKEEEKPHGCIHMQNPDNPLSHHHDCR